MPVNRHADATAEQSAPPDPHAALVNIVHAHQMRRGRIPPRAPLKAADLATWWMNHQPPRDKHEYPRQLPVPGKETRQRWHDPYLERVTLTLQKFLLLEHDQQRYILAAWEDGIAWRGEDVVERYEQLEGRTLFENIVHETERMREIGRDAYITELRKRARRTVKNMQSGAS